MKIWHISDTHSYHSQLFVPYDIDMVIFSGDCSNSKDFGINSNEVDKFLDWFIKLPIKYKVMIAGNHDTSFEKRMWTKDFLDSMGVIYLENESEIIEGVKIFGSPYTPTFGVGWSFNRDRVKLDRVWRNIIPDDADIIITHGPPKGILDLTSNRDKSLERCGDKSLLNRLKEVQPKLSLFGHIHNRGSILNQGTMKLSTLDTTFSNGSVVDDNKFGQLSSNGNILEYQP